MNLVKSFQGLILITLSVCLLVLGFFFAGIDQIMKDIKQFPIWVLSVMLFAFALNLFLVSFRLSRIMAFFSVKLPFPIVFSANVNGYFASLFFISLFGQVAGRQSVFRKFDLNSSLVAALTGIERTVTLIVTLLMSFIAAIWIFELKEIIEFIISISILEILFVAIAALIISLWLGKTQFEKLLLSLIHSKLIFLKISEMILITICCQCLVIGSFVVGGYALAPELDILDILAASIIVSFVASLPISVNGWGVREVTSIFVFGSVGMGASTALIISVVVGLCSTFVILILFPSVLKNQFNQVSPNILKKQIKPSFSLDKIAIWFISTSISILIFFQIHVPLPGGIINLNLADPFAILSLAALATHLVFSRSKLNWLIPGFNIILFLISSLIIFSFLNGLLTIGLTQWAFAGRLLGWLVLLGYVSIGILTVTQFGKLGILRMIETMIITSMVIILFHVVIRLLFPYLDFFNITLNFEGFSGNRNAFAFQLLNCFLLLLAYSADQKNKIILKSNNYILRSERFFVLMLGIIISGIIFTGSRAGMFTCFVLILYSIFTAVFDKRLLAKGLLFAMVFWLLIVFIVPFIHNFIFTYIFDNQSYIYNPSIQSIFSNQISDLVRWDSIYYGIELWQSSPWFGAGLGVFRELSSQWFEKSNVIHSTPIWVLAEFGLFGATILMCIFIWILYMAIFRKLKIFNKQSIIMLLVCFLTFSLVHEIFYQRIFWLAFGLSAAFPLKKYFYK